MKKTRIVEISILLVFIIVFILSFIFRKETELLITKGNFIEGLLIIFILSIFLDFFPQYITPHALLIQMKLFGSTMLLPSIVVAVGSLIGSSLAFYLGKKYHKKIINRYYNEKDYKKIKNKINHHGKWFIALASISPLPYIPLIFGSLDIKTQNFIFFGLFPRILGILVFGFLINLIVF